MGDVAGVVTKLWVLGQEAGIHSRVVFLWTFIVNFLYRRVGINFLDEELCVGGG